MKGNRLWAKNNRDFKIIINWDATFDKSNLPYLSDRNTKSAFDIGKSSDTKMHIELKFTLDLTNEVHEEDEWKKMLLIMGN